MGHTAEDNLAQPPRLLHLSEATTSVKQPFGSVTEQSLPAGKQLLKTDLLVNRESGDSFYVNPDVK